MKLRHTLTAIAIGATVVTMYADIIIKNDGTTINAYDVEIGSKSVIYSESQNADATIKRIPIADVFAVKIGDGPITPVNAQSTSQPQVQGEIKPVPAADNAALIAAYNKETPYHPTKKFGGYTQDVLVYYSVSDESVLSTDEVEIAIAHCEPKENSKKGWWNWDKWDYRIAIRNKTDKPVYIDLANTFRTSIKGESESWYDGAMYTQSSGSGSGVSLGLGAVAGALGVGGAVGTLANGIAVGGGSSSGTTVSKGVQRIMAIGPHSTGYLPTHPHIIDKKIEERPERFEDYSPLGEKDKWSIRKWELREFNITNTPLTRAYYLTISTTPDFSTHFTLPVKLYARAAYGTPSLEYPDVLPEKPDDPWSIYDYDHMIIGLYYLCK